MPYFDTSVQLLNLLDRRFVFCSGDIKELIDRDFGGFDKFKELMSADTVAIQGSGWGWLGWNPKTGRLRITTQPNQDPLSVRGKYTWCMVQ